MCIRDRQAPHRYLPRCEQHSLDVWGFRDVGGCPHLDLLLGADHVLGGGVHAGIRSSPWFENRARRACPMAPGKGGSRTMTILSEPATLQQAMAAAVHRHQLLPLRA